MEKNYCFILIVLLLSACEAAENDRLTVCTKEECCCPDSIVIDVWDKQLGFAAWKPKVLRDDAKWEAINAINASECVELPTQEPEYVIRAWYPGSSNPRVFKIKGSYVREDSQDWFDTGVEDFGSKLYNE